MKIFYSAALCAIAIPSLALAEGADARPPAIDQGQHALPPDPTKPVSITLDKLGVLLNAALMQGRAKEQAGLAEPIMQDLVKQATPVPKAP